MAEKRSTFESRWVQAADWPAIEQWLSTEPELVGPWGVVRHPFVIVATRDNEPVAAISLVWGAWGYGMVDWLIRDPENPKSRGAGSYVVKMALETLRGLGMKGCAAVVHESRRRVLQHDLRLPGVTQQAGQYHLINLVFEE